MQNSKLKIGIVTEDVAALPKEFLKENEIELAFAILNWPEIEKMPGENIWKKMRNAEKYGVKTLPKTSQATPKSYFDAFKKQLEKFEKVLCLTVSSKISGCYNSAIQAKEMLPENEKERIFIFDTQNAAASQALLVLKAIELIQEQWEIDEILEKLKELIPKTHLYFIVEDPKYLLSIGRITKTQANWIRRMKKIGLHPIAEFKKGIIKRGGVVFAKDISQALFKKVSKESKKERKKGKKIRVIINHCDNFEKAKELKDLLKEIEAEVSFISEGPDIFVAGGPGTLISGWMPIE